MLPETGEQGCPQDSCSAGDVLGQDDAPTDRVSDRLGTRDERLAKGDPQARDGSSRERRLDREVLAGRSEAKVSNAGCEGGRGAFLRQGEGSEKDQNRPFRVRCSCFLLRFCCSHGNRRIPIKLRTRDPAEYGSPATQEPIMPPKERFALIKSQIDQDIAKRKERDASWDNVIDVSIILLRSVR